MKRLTDTQKSEIRGLRACGLGYGSIAKRLSLSRDTVRSFCVRNNVQAGIATQEKLALKEDDVAGTTAANKAGGASEIKIGDTVFIITTGYSKNASETLEQKLAKLILNEAAMQIA